MTSQLRILAALTATALPLSAQLTPERLVRDLGLADQSKETELCDLNSNLMPDVARIKDESLYVQVDTDPFENMYPTGVTGVCSMAAINYDDGERPSRLLVVGSGLTRIVTIGAEDGLARVVNRPNWFPSANYVNAIRQGDAYVGCAVDTDTGLMFPFFWDVGVTSMSHFHPVNVGPGVIGVTFTDTNGDGIWEIAVHLVTGVTIYDFNGVVQSLEVNPQPSDRGSLVRIDSNGTEQLAWLRHDIAGDQWELVVSEDGAPIDSLVMPSDHGFDANAPDMCLAAGDINGDGYDDLVVRTVDQRLLILNNMSGVRIDDVFDPAENDYVDISSSVTPSEIPPILVGNVNRGRGGPNKCAEQIICDTAEETEIMFSMSGEEFPVILDETFEVTVNPSGSPGHIMTLRLDVPPDFGFADHVQYAVYRDTDIADGNNTPFMIPESCKHPKLDDLVDDTLNIQIDHFGDFLETELYFVQIRFVKLEFDSSDPEIYKIRDSSPCYILGFHAKESGGIAEQHFHAHRTAMYAVEGGLGRLSGETPMIWDPATDDSELEPCIFRHVGIIKKRGIRPDWDDAAPTGCLCNH